MSNYSTRAKFYHVEFRTTDDFPFIRWLLRKSIAPVLDIPGGVGRLLPLYAEVNDLESHLVDREPAMYFRCREEIKRMGLNHRVYAHMGDMRTWRSPNKFGLILIARGGLQLLPCIQDVVTTLKNLRANLKPSGLLYVDIHNPWAVQSNTTNRSPEIPELPEFMQFYKSTCIEGENQYSLSGDGVLIRRFCSTLTKSFVEVKFTYPSENKSSVQKYFAYGKWLHISKMELLKVAGYVGLDLEEWYGDYEHSPLSPNSPRIVAVFRSGR